MSNILIVVHGTTRSAESCRDAFENFADRHGCVVLAPLFPCGILEDDDMDNYKRVKFHDIRFDLLLLEMVDEVAARCGIARERFERFLLHGFSGGGQFAHRFFYLHPGRLRAVSIGAPGAVTLLDDTSNWWVGTRDTPSEFGKNLDVSSMRGVEVQVVIGAEDHGAEEVKVPRTSKHWMEGAIRACPVRQARLATLQRNLEESGIAVERAFLPGVGHDGSAVLPAVEGFFARVLRR